ncbi:uncharacterized protein CLAFUR5_05275 [Fulvia fulva]|uniref:Uncharacterized protein n=1 Tax=Passalora fulva TaxID=5499 RepID=A0A9Q8P8J5_PASFU|nr:uncharacterized protein CLAFUR5_05275 [Fulvia fulva]KAK4617148.1 hypothetical protein CLAFUR0_10576 [Fulvia fulva]UJO16966.1 hypothetical protein CLAFUR5_05275 [Fulvia fulva]
MYTPGLALTMLTAFAAAAPQPLSTRGGDAETFKLHVYNNCSFPKSVAIYQITSDFQMLEKSKPTSLKAKTGKTVIEAPYKALGMRLSGHAEWGTAGQWKTQALFEFGYGEYMGAKGTAYNLSVMEGSDADIGIGGYPIANGKGSGTCTSKTCFPWDCPLDQGWTNPDQTEDGSPADTVCYHGKTDFKVVFCP